PTRRSSDLLCLNNTGLPIFNITIIAIMPVNGKVSSSTVTDTIKSNALFIITASRSIDILSDNHHLVCLLYLRQFHYHLIIPCSLRDSLYILYDRQQPQVYWFHQDTLFLPDQYHIEIWLPLYLPVNRGRRC